ncbi:ROK family protein [Treponema maltophilum]|uniref:ROK family protein n=1 Tax=Treponema maltophilum TaxID=51160 RepID=UPI003D8EF11D
MKITNNSDVRVRNASVIYSCLRDHKSLTKSQLVSATGLSFVSVSKLSNRMVEKGLLLADIATASTGGRKASTISFNSNFRYCLVVDFHHTEHFSLGIVNFACEIIYRIDLPISLNDTLEDLMDKLITAYHEISIELSSKIVGVVVVVSAVCAIDATILLQSSNPLFEGVNISHVFENLFPNLPIIIDNDANIASLSQIDRGEQDYLFILMTQGIGMGIVINGTIYRGFNGYAGELGHFKIQGINKKCKCGQSGCLRLVSTLESIANDLGESELLRGIDGVRYAKRLAERYKSGEEKVKQRVNLAADKLGETMSQLFDIFNPDCIYAGGNIWPLFPFFRSIVVQKCREYAKLAAYHDLRVCFIDQSSTVLILTGGGQTFFQYWLSHYFEKVL